MATPEPPGTSVFVARLVYVNVCFCLFFMSGLIMFESLRAIRHTDPSEFKGAEFWKYDKRDLQLCNDPAVDNNWVYEKTAICFTYIHNMQVVKIEILSSIPGVILYRDLFTEKQVSDYLKMLEKLEMSEQEVQNEKGEAVVNYVRVANGTRVDHTKHQEAASVLATVETMFPQIDFEYAETQLALSYLPGGHYAPHHDFITTPYEYQDLVLRKMGNRLATLIMVFQTAEKGGATIFPYLNVAARPNPGDALFWFNIKGDLSMEQLSLHGGCPVYKGKKVISTIWIRSADQIVLKMAPKGSIPADAMFTPFYYSPDNE